MLPLPTATPAAPTPGTHGNPSSPVTSALPSPACCPRASFYEPLQSIGDPEMLSVQASQARPSGLSSSLPPPVSSSPASKHRRCRPVLGPLLISICTHSGNLIHIQGFKCHLKHARRAPQNSRLAHPPPTPQLCLGVRHKLPTPQPSPAPRSFLCQSWELWLSSCSGQRRWSSPWLVSLGRRAGQSPHPGPSHQQCSQGRPQKPPKRCCCLFFPQPHNLFSTDSQSDVFNT